MRTSPTETASPSASGSCSYSAPASAETWIVAPVASREPSVAGDVVGVRVRLEHVADLEAVLLGEREVLLDLPLRVDHGRLAPVGDDVGRAAEVLVQHLAEEHGDRDHTAVRFDRRELAGAVADLGVFVPIAVALIVSNGLSPTAVLLPAGLLYLANAVFYGLPLPAQPLKAFGAIAIAEGLGSDEIAAGRAAPRRPLPRGRDGSGSSTAPRARSRGRSSAACS